MKKVLLATTAVVLSAGVAAADVTLSGSGRFGLYYNGTDTVLEKRMTVNIDASTETTSGLTFGGRIRMRSNEASVAMLSGARVYMKSGNVEIGVGNIYGAIDSMPNLYASEVGLTALSDAGVVANTIANPATAWGYDGFSSTGVGSEGVEVIFSAGSFAGHLSYSEQVLSSGAAGAERLAAHVAYTFGDWTAALGVQDSDNNNEDKTILTVGGKIGDFGVGFAAADNNGERKITLNGSATFGATTVNGFISDEESGADTAYGLGVSYDLGGASIVGGIEHDAAGNDTADLGVSFSF